MDIAYVSRNGDHVNDDGTDNYAYEEKQEQDELNKRMHPAMKAWYNQPETAFLKDALGEFPLFWQELSGWTHFKSVKKLYLTVEDKKANGDAPDLEAIWRDITQPAPQQPAEADEPNPDPAASAPVEEQPQAQQEQQQQQQQQPVKKRRNRWGDAPAPSADGDTNGTAAAPATDGQNGADPNGTAASEERERKRRSRWSQAAENPTAAAASIAAALSIPTAAPAGVLSQEKMQQTIVLQMQLKQVNERLVNVAQEANARRADPNRSPSPPPQFDSNGVRTNTREMRLRERLQKERGMLIEEIMRINPFFKPPADFVKSKPFKKLYIPHKQYPNYNFIGLIIGPRGNTQKRMEQETGCKISIRGKGSVKEGSKGRAGKSADDDDELHVYVTGDDEEAVERAAKMVEELLVPVDDEKNEHKQKQLRELALINGTLREDEYCHICGEKGHRQYECPNRVKKYKAAAVQCRICGDSSHPTRDCPRRTSEQQTNDAALDQEYLSFINEIDGGGADPAEKKGGGAGGDGDATKGGGISIGAGSNVSYAAPIPAPAPVQQTVMYATAPPAWATAQPYGQYYGYPGYQQSSYYGPPGAATTYGQPPLPPTSSAPYAPAGAAAGYDPSAAYGQPGYSYYQPPPPPPPADGGYAQPPLPPSTSSYPAQPPLPPSQPPLPPGGGGGAAAAAAAGYYGAEQPPPPPPPQST